MARLNVTSLISALVSLTVLFNAAGVHGVFPITGVAGSVQVRRELRDLHTNHAAQWNLFMLALQQFQAQSQSNFLSYFGVMGIHGVPCQAWDGSQRSGNGCGYCVHQSNLFMSWHRPYVALYEMEVFAAAKAIAAQYPANIRQQYVQAASTLRIPYWDWAIRPRPGTSEFLALFTSPTTSVLTPTGQKTINNPLFHYSFHPNPHIFSGAFNGYQSTMRYPVGQGSSARSQNNLAVATFNQNTASTRSALYSFFSNCNNWLDLSNSGSSGVEGNCPTTLEQLHNNIHLQVGGLGNQLGHMSVISYSAFDPVFMMHHANVDRLFAMWQALHPGATEPSARQSQGTFAYNQGSTQGAQSPLKPFHRNAAGQYWTSAACYNHTLFHYTYPDFLSGGSASAIRARIKTLYGPNAKAGVAKRAVSPLTATNGTLYAYLAEVTSTRFGLGGSYAAYVFVDQPASADPSTWSYDPNLAGMLGVFADAGMQGNTATTTGMVSLTEMLTKKVAAGEISSLDQAVVVPFLTTNLVWKVVNPAGQVVDPTTVPDFLITVFATTIGTDEADDELPVYSPYETLTSVTHGKAGGHGSAARI